MWESGVVQIALAYPKFSCNSSQTSFLTKIVSLLEFLTVYFTMFHVLLKFESYQ